MQTVFSVGRDSDQHQPFEESDGIDAAGRPRRISSYRLKLSATGRTRRYAMPASPPPSSQRG